MHYLHTSSMTQLFSLRCQATIIASFRLRWVEPLLRKEFEFVLDFDCHSGI
ncbi:hypothetical protein AMTRI_Chr03g141820 [Amborella trichopoda]